MPTVADVLNTLDQIAPTRIAFEWDHVGLQVGDSDGQVSKGVVSLDRSLAAVNKAIETGAQLLLTHHPLIWDPLKAVTESRYEEKTVRRLVKHDIAFIAAHTNWDCAQGGVNDTLAAKLGLLNITSFGMSQSSAMLKMAVFVPAGSAEEVIDAASSVGAGVIGFYRRCAFKGRGVGTFYGGEGAHPSVGNVGEVEEVEEVRVEMVLPARLRQAVSNAVFAAHPYEEPAVDFYQLHPASGQPLSRMGVLGSPLNLREFAGSVDSALSTRSWAFGDPSKRIAKVAVCGVAADDEWRNAQAAGADVLVTGEVKQHVGLEASESSFAVIAAGHYATEHPGCESLAKRLREALPEIEWQVFTPAQGFSGRPF